MIFVGMRGRCENVCFLALKTKIHNDSKSQKYNFMGEFDSEIKKTLSRFIKKHWDSIASFSCPLGLVYLLSWAPLMLI